MNGKRKQFSKINFNELNGYSRKSTIWNYFFLKRENFFGDHKPIIKILQK